MTLHVVSGGPTATIPVQPLTGRPTIAHTDIGPPIDGFFGSHSWEREVTSARGVEERNPYQVGSALRTRAMLSAS